MYQADPNQNDRFQQNLEPENAETAIVYTTAMLTQAERALTDARKHQNSDNPDAALAAIANASYCHNIATQWLASADQLSKQAPDISVPHDTHNSLSIKAQQLGTVMQFTLEEAVETIQLLGHDEDTLRWYSNRMQPVHTLASFRYIQTLLNADHSTDTTWNEQYRTACIETMEQLAYQPQFEPMDDLEAQRLQAKPDAYTADKLDAQQNYEHATRQISQLCAAALQDYNDAIPLVTSPAMRWFPILSKSLAEMPISTLGLLPGLHCNETTTQHMLPQILGDVLIPPVPPAPQHDTGPQDEGFIAYVAFIYDGAKYIQAIQDPYPKGFPANLVVEHMEASIHHIMECMDSPDEQHPALTSCGFLETMEARLTSALLGLHDVTADDLMTLINVANKLRLPHGARVAMIDAVSNWDMDLVALILKDTPYAYPKMASRKQAGKIVHAARQAGLDHYQLVQLAEMLGHEPRKLGVKTPRLSARTFDALRETAQQVGLPPEAINSMLDALEDSDEPPQLFKSV